MGTYLILLHFALPSFAHIEFLQIEDFSNPISAKPISMIFPMASTHFVSMCHVLLILIYSELFIFMFVMVVIKDLWSVTFDVLL